MSKATVAQLVLLASPLALVELARATPGLLGLETCAPHWLAAGAAFAALRVDALSACVWAATAGLLADVPSGTPFGLGGARLALITALLHSQRHELDLTSPLLRPVGVALVAFADQLLAALAIALFAEGPIAIGPLVGHGALVALATAVIAPVVWPAAELLVRTADPRRDRS